MQCVHVVEYLQQSGMVDWSDMVVWMGLKNEVQSGKSKIQ